MWLMWLAICFGALFLAALLVVVLVQADSRNLRRSARRFPCTRCQGILGDRAVSLADDLWMKHMRTLRERHPGMRFRIVRGLHAVCTKCGARFKFDRDLRAFLETECVLSFEAS